MLRAMRSGPVWEGDGGEREKGVASRCFFEEGPQSEMCVMSRPVMGCFVGENVVKLLWC